MESSRCDGISLLLENQKDKGISNLIKLIGLH